VEDLTFPDLAVLERIDENTVLEKFGTKINSSFFDAANMLGTLKQKGYVDIRSQFPGPSQVVLTDTGKGILALAREKAAQELENLDEVMLSLIANGYKDPKMLTDKLNMRTSDVAYHLNRLVTQDFASYVFRSGKIELSLTDQGFKKAGYAPIGSEDERRRESEDVEAIIKEHRPAAPAILAAPSAPSAPAEPGVPAKLDQQARMKAKMEYYSQPNRWIKYAAIAAAVILALAAAYYFLFMK